MTRHIPISEFKDHASELVAAAEHGEEIVITRHGKPAVVLRSIDDTNAERETRARAALASLDRMREEAAKRGQRATAEEWVAWKREGQR